MELELLRALEWRFNAPTVHAFVDLLLRLVDVGRLALPLLATCHIGAGLGGWGVRVLDELLEARRE